MIELFETVRQVRPCVCYNGANVGDVRELAMDTPVTVAEAERGFLVLHEPGREDRVITPGMWVSLWDGMVEIHSQAAFLSLFRPAPDSKVT